MIDNLLSLLSSVDEVEDMIHKQYLLAELLGQLKKMESSNRLLLAEAYGGDATLKDDHFNVVIKTPIRVEADQAKVAELYAAGWDADVLGKAFPIKHGISKKVIADVPGLEYAVITKSGMPTVKVTSNQD